MKNMISFTLTALVMFCFWILLSGHFSILMLSLGAASSLLVAYLSHDLFWGGKDLKKGIGVVARFVKYLPWLFWQIVVANVYLVYLTLHPKMPIEPDIIKFKTDLKSDLGVVLLANSITLTPGTVTIDGNYTEFAVHAITENVAQGILDGNMQARVMEVEGNNV